MKIGIVPVGPLKTLPELYTILELRKSLQSQAKPCKIILFDVVSRSRAFKQISNNSTPALIETIQHSVKQLYHNGAEIAIIPNHLLRQAFEGLKPPIKLMNVVDAVTDKCRSSNHRSVCLIGSSMIVEDNLYQDSLAEVGISTILPSQEDQKTLQSIITKAEQTIALSRSAQEKVRAIFSKLKKENSFSSLLLTHLELREALPESFTEVEMLNPYLLLAKKVAALVSSSPVKTELVPKHPSINISLNTSKKGLPLGIWTE